MASRRKKKANKRSKEKERKGIIGRTLSSLICLCAVALLALTGAYFLGSVELRTKIESQLSKALFTIRGADWTPKPMDSLFASIEDQVPDTDQFVVDAEEAGRDGSHFAAGIPRGVTELTLANSASRATLYDISRRAVCVAARLTAEAANEYPVEWKNKQWSGLVEMLSQEYPRRFREIWLYTGPVYASSGAGAPHGYYAIALDITEAGGLRAISFLVPKGSEVRDYSTYLSSIAEIEGLTKLRFLPALQYDAQRSLGTWRSERLW